MTTTCLTCPGDKMYNIVCNFSIGINHYACNPQTTCMRADGTYDCCANNIVRCIVDASSLLVPTIQPSMPISATDCNQTCDKIDKCYWYERLRTDNMCKENNNEYCCSQNRADCCMTNKTGAYIVFGCIAGIMIMTIAAYYRYYIKKPRNKVVPTKYGDVSTKEPAFV